LNTDSISAIKHIFCRRKGLFSSRIGCGRAHLSDFRLDSARVFATTCTYLLRK
jgi:hypothetical protein